MNSPAEGHLGYFLFGAIMNKATLNICEQVFVQTQVIIFLKS
jgi:hypothetical protein